MCIYNLPYKSTYKSEQDNFLKIKINALQLICHLQVLVSRNSKFCKGRQFCYISSFDVC